MRKYTTAQGDMWDEIAYKELGDVRHTDRLMMANTGYRDVYIFSAGITLIIPDVETSKTGVMLPPWKQVQQ